MNVRSATVIEATEGEIDGGTTSPSHIGLDMLCAVARAPDGEVLLTVFESGSACAVQLSSQQAEMVAAQLTGRTQ